MVRLLKPFPQIPVHDAEVMKQLEEQSKNRVNCTYHPS